MALNGFTPRFSWALETAIHHQAQTISFANCCAERATDLLFLVRKPITGHADLDHPTAVELEQNGLCLVQKLPVV
ncbi:MAG TPA: hypothetical protein VN737_19300 [Bryobacteraceae bacterium]|nr:hypothetical protein [Bryobacteraceae bacterium]